MSERIYVVKYSGPFGFIKPWTAVRDSETFSQQFLTPSIVEGIEKKLFPELLRTQGIHKIMGHRLNYDQVSEQQEVIQTRGWNSRKKGKYIHFERPTAIILRGILQNPTLFLAFASKSDAIQANNQHICLCRNEDILLPKGVTEIDAYEFDNEELFPGFELVFENTDRSFPVGINRYTRQQMYGWLKIVGKPVYNYQ